MPKTGMQVHAEYTLYGHCFLLRDLSRGAEKIRLFLDQDSGMRAAALGAFAERVADRTADAFYVRINKDMTVDERKHALKDSREHFRALAEEHPELDRQALRLFVIKEALADMSVIGHWKDRWLTHPFPSMSEPEKAVCYLTDYDEDHLAWLYNKASLRAIDAFFMQVRRRLSLLERPIATASNERRVWHGGQGRYRYRVQNDDPVVPAVAGRHLRRELRTGSELAEAGEIGTVAEFQYSLMGAGWEPHEIAETAQQVAGLLKEDEVNAALLVPV